jgi:BRCT domain type II-containing protein
MATKRSIQGSTFLFTGTLTEFTREEAEAMVKDNGGSVLSGVTGKLNYLVVGENAGSKLAQAEALGTVNILTEKGFLAMTSAKAVVQEKSKGKLKSDNKKVVMGENILNSKNVKKSSKS